MNTRFLNALTLLVVALPLSATATPVLVDGIEWQQPLATVGHSHDEVAGICDTESGLCSGLLGETDVTGWTWASASEVGNLFAALTPHPGGIFNYFESQSTWAPALVEMFDQTQETIAIRQVIGLTRTGYASDPARLATGAELRDWYGDYNNNADGAFSNTGYWRHTQYPNIGHWFYRAQVASVPEPGSLGLLSLALIAMGAARRRS